MLIENMMYFALGVLVAGLIALIILPAVWKRAVRLTKRRIEAATPITMAEFRADKDQLRAEFALTTRRLEMTIETLRGKLAEQLGEFNQARSDLGVLNAERTRHEAIVQDLEIRATELQARLGELERENTDLAQKLRMRERELEVRTQDLAALRETPPADEDNIPPEPEDVLTAQARIANAENRLNALLAETGQVVEITPGHNEPLLADELTQEEELGALRSKVADVESAILTDWDSDTADEAALREKLNDIAANVSRLVYAVETDNTGSGESESLFDRVQRFADDGDSLTDPPPDTTSERSSAVSNRMAALQEIRGR
jgi:chromosome segregation ATPase